MGQERALRSVGDCTLSFLRIPQLAEQLGASPRQPTLPCQHACYSSTSLFIFLPSMMLQTQARCVIQGGLHLVDKKAYVPAHALLSFQKLPGHTRRSLFAFTARP